MSHRAPELVVGVSGMIANESPAPGTAVIRSLRASPSFNGKVVGLAYDAMEAGNFIEGVADEVFLVPYPSQGHEDYFKRLLYIKQRTGLNALIPTLDAELLPIIQMSDWLKAKGIATFLPTQEQFRLRAKDQLFQMAARHALPVPRSLSLFDPAMLWSLDREVRYPLLIKGIFYEAYLARDPQEAAAHFEKIRQKWGLPVVVQEFVPGDEYDVAAVGDGRGGVVGAVPMRKMQLSDKGKAWAGVTVSDDKLMELARKTIKALKWRGPLELEVMKSRGAYYIIEINPRFPAWIYLAQGAGQNLPLACLELALGRTPAPFAPHKPGVVFMRSAMDFIMPMSKLQALTADGECHEYGSQKV